MAMPQTVPSSMFPGMSENISMEELAAFFRRSVLTIRKWFESVPGVIRTPRGRQRPTLSVPPAILRGWMMERGHPDAVIEGLLADHRRRAEEVVDDSPPSKSPKSVKNRKSVKSIKSVKTAKRASRRRE